jgi:succinate dehydrogenase/fumarate reductase flavoprotein subunit
MEIKKLVTDVLVVGGGSTGLIAALEAEKHGADVTIICKQKAGRSGNTIVSGSAFSVVVPEEGNPDSEEIYFNDLIRSGKGINQKELTRTLAFNSGKTIKWLEDYGMEFFKTNSEYVKRQPPGHSHPRSVPTIWDGYSYLARGLSFMKPLSESVIKRNIRVMEQTVVAHLLTTNGKIAGAIAIDINESEFIVISCKSIILANGGAGGMFSHNNNTVGITGDSYALAYEAGAVLKDMEFVQFYPTQMIKPLKMPASNPLFGDGAVLRNKDKELFIHRYVEGGDKAATRDKMAQAIFQEVERGYGVEGGVYFDCSGIPKEVLESKYSHFCNQLKKKGVDPQKDMVIVSPTTHYFLGGVKINTNCESSIPGLYAAGEAATGTHGANRLSGSSIADTVVFGKIAGESAAEYSAVNQHAKINSQDLSNKLEKLKVNSKGEESLADKKELVRTVMWRSASVVREESILREGLKQLYEVESILDNIAVRNYKEIVSFQELANMITVGKLTIKGALERKESRGSHWRRDYPDQSEDYLGNFEYSKSSDGDLINYRPLDGLLINN